MLVVQKNMSFLFSIFIFHRYLYCINLNVALTLVLAHKMDLSQTIITFGKHNGKTYAYVKQTDVAYCNWALKQMNVGGRMLHLQQWLKQKTRKVTCECCNGSGLVDAL